MENNKIFNRDFTLVVIGQIISLFGNSIMRFALPLYLLNQTHSASLFGLVSACAFIPMIVLSPIGGIMADRVNKRNIMVILDFSTAALALGFTLFLGHIDLVVLIFVTLIILYAIQGAYQPSVQASIPALIAPESLVPANSVVTLVNSLSGLIGPVIGGAVFGFWGITPILLVSIVCFFSSAVMEIFIHIPFEKKEDQRNMFSIAIGDIKESMEFILHGERIIGKIAIFIAAINLILSALLIVGLPVIITQHLGFSQSLGNQLYGYCQGAMAAGGLAGGILTGVLSKKLNVKKSWQLLLLCGLTLLPMGLTLLLAPAPIISYVIIVICSFLAMIVSTIFSIQMLSFLQLITPADLIGKIMSLAMCFSMCANPLGQAIYGVLFQKLSSNSYILFLGAFTISCLIAFVSRKTFETLDK